MITYCKSNLIAVSGFIAALELYGKSTDEKPTENIPNASVFYEMDTKKLFMFDADGKAWLEQ